MPDFLEITIRAILAYFTLLLLARLMGKREISQLTFFDYIVGISIGSITGNLITNTTLSFLTLLPAIIVFSSLQIIISYITLKSPSLRTLFKGTKTVLIENGNINEKNMRKTRINLDELTSKLREKNVFKFQDVEFAFIETDGQFSVQKKGNKQPVTPSDLNMPTEYSGYSPLLIEDGVINEQVLRNKGLTKSWLKQQLSDQGVLDINQVMLGQIDNMGNLYIDLSEEKNQQL